jgi:hypothetical protein
MSNTGSAGPLFRAGEQPACLRFRRGARRYAGLAHFHCAFGTPHLGRGYDQILWPRRHLPKFANGVCRYSEILVCSELSWQNIPLKDRTDFQGSIRFWPHRLFAFELRRCGHCGCRCSAQASRRTRYRARPRADRTYDSSGPTIRVCKGLVREPDAGDPPVRFDEGYVAESDPPLRFRNSLFCCAEKCLEAIAGLVCGPLVIEPNPEEPHLARSTGLGSIKSMNCVRCGKAASVGLVFFSTARSFACCCA